MFQLLLDKLTSHIDLILYDSAVSCAAQRGQGGTSSSESVTLQSCVDVVYTTNGTELTFREDVQSVIELVASVESYLEFHRLGSIGFGSESNCESAAKCFNGLVDCLALGRCHPGMLDELYSLQQIRISFSLCYFFLQINTSVIIFPLRQSTLFFVFVYCADTYPSMCMRQTASKGKRIGSSNYEL